MATLTALEPARRQFEYSALAGAVAAYQGGDMIQVGRELTPTICRHHHEYDHRGSRRHGRPRGHRNATAGERGCLIIGADVSDRPRCDARQHINYCPAPRYRMRTAATGAGIRSGAATSTLTTLTFSSDQERAIWRMPESPTGTMPINARKSAGNGNAQSPASGDRRTISTSAPLSELTIDNSYSAADPCRVATISRAGQRTRRSRIHLIDDPNGYQQLRVDLPIGSSARKSRTTSSRREVRCRERNFVSFGKKATCPASSSLSVTGNTLMRR